MEPASHLNITANRDDYDTYTDVQKILKEIKPNWKKENIEIQSLGGGFINKTLRVVHDGDFSDGLIIRINGSVGELVGLSRTKEIEYIRLLNENGLGVPLVVSFNNGIVSKLVSGKTLDDVNLVEKMVDEDFVRKFSKMLARMHHIARKETGPLTKDNNRLMILAKTGLKMVRQIQNNKSLAKFNELVTWDEMEKEIDFIYSEAEKLQMPIGLSHNDLWHTNILYDQDKDTINMIDYETMDVNFLPFDIASYLIFLLRNHILPVALPTPKHIPSGFTDFFIRCYLEAKAEFECSTASPVTKDDIKTFHKWTDMCMMVYLLLYTPPMIYITYYQQQHGIDLDCAEIAKLWYNEYKVLKTEYKF